SAFGVRREAPQTFSCLALQSLHASAMIASRCKIVSVPATDPAPVTAGRDAQRRRTRRAIVAAAGEMLADGHTPTVAEIAERAEVSPRTVHVHFTTLEQLLTD